MRKVLITGSCGFLGHHLTKKLDTLGLYTIGVDNLSTGKRKYAKYSDDFIWDDFGFLTAEDLEGVEWIFHTAALPRVPYSIEHPLETHDANVNQTLNLLIAARDAGVKKFIYSSSSSVYGGQDHYPTNEEDRTIPLSPYALQKLAAEQYCEVFRRVYGLPTVSLRYFNIFGEEQPADNAYTGVLTIFMERAKKGEPLTIFGDGTQTRDFTYVQDVVDANICVAESGEGIYNVGTEQNYSINKIAGAVSDNIVYGPPRVGDPKTSLADTRRLRTLGWHPQMDILTWIREQKSK